MMASLSILASCVRLFQLYVFYSRGSAEAFAGDEKAAQLALDVISKGWDKAGDHFTFHQRQFVYLPLMHSEQKETQVSITLAWRQTRNNSALTTFDAFVQ